MVNGTIKFFHKDLGWGFITPNDGSVDIFVHVTASGFTAGAYLLPGTSVWYTVEWDARYHNWRVKICTGFKKPADFSNLQAHGLSLQASMPATDVRK